MLASTALLDDQSRARSASQRANDEGKETQSRSDAVATSALHPLAEWQPSSRPRAKTVKFLTTLNEGESSELFRRRTQCFQAGEYRRVQLSPGQVVPRLNLRLLQSRDGDLTPIKPFTVKPSEASMLRFEALAAKRRAATNTESKLSVEYA